MYDPWKRAYSQPVLRLLHLRDDQLPPILDPREPAGALLGSVAGDTGLPSGIPVSVAVHDQYAAALGASVVEPGEVMFGAGTAWVLMAISSGLPRPIVPEALICHHVAEGLHGQILSLQTGGSALRWVKDFLGLQDLSEEAFDELLEQTAPGAGGVECWPFFAPAPPTGLGKTVRARFTGLQFGTQRAQLARAALEGLAFELNRQIEYLRCAHHTPRRVTMCGGGARSGVTPRLIADVTGLPVRVCSGGEESAAGALVLARGTAGT